MIMRDGKRVTLDNEWDEDELATDVSDECIKLIPHFAFKYKGRLLHDDSLLLPQYVCEKICSENDLIERYNTEYDKHRDENKFGIHWFDIWLRGEIEKIEKSNLVSG